MIFNMGITHPQAYDDCVWDNTYTHDGGFFAALRFKSQEDADKFRADYKLSDDHTTQIWSIVVVQTLEKEELQLILSSVADEYGGEVIVEEQDVAFSLLIGAQ